VSQQTGFCDQSYFGTVFRTLAKMTPLTYRRRFGDTPQPTTLRLCVTDHSTDFSWPLRRQGENDGHRSDFSQSAYLALTDGDTHNHKITKRRQN
jgi:hypothetical protein